MQHSRGRRHRPARMFATADHKELCPICEKPIKHGQPIERLPRKRKQPWRHTVCSGPSN